jgi:hypothetical protein
MRTAALAQARNQVGLLQRKIAGLEDALDEGKIDGYFLAEIGDAVRALDRAASLDRAARDAIEAMLREREK